MGIIGADRGKQKRKDKEDKNEMNRVQMEIQTDVKALCVCCFAVR